MRTIAASRACQSLSLIWSEGAAVTCTVPLASWSPWRTVIA